MRLFRGLDLLPAFRRAVTTVGSYDGVHAGHRVLLKRAAAEARTSGGESVVVTFDPHPRLALEREPGLKLLTTLREKCLLLEEAGIDNLVVIPFDRAFSLTPPHEFIRLLREKVGTETLVVGYDHRFGRDKAGGFELLKRMHDQAPMRLIEVAEQELGREHLSSTAIRRLVAGGEMAHAARLLGHPYLLMAETLADGSLRPGEPHKLLPPAGSYPVRAEGRSTTLHIDGGGLRLDDATPPAAGTPRIITFEP